MNASTLRTSLAALALAGMTVLSIPAPAKADSAATTRTIIGAAAAIAGIATAINISNKNREHNTVVGYLSDGSTVYADGHVVSPNGSSWYPGNQGERIACNGQQCSVYGGNGQYGYNNQYPYNNNGYGNQYPYNNGGYYYGQSAQRNVQNPGHHYGWTRGRGNERKNGDDNGGGDR